MLALDHPLLVEHYPFSGVVIDFLLEKFLKKDVPLSNLDNNVPTEYDAVNIQVEGIEVLVQVFPVYWIPNRTYDVRREGAF